MIYSEEDFKKEKTDSEIMDVCHLGNHQNINNVVFYLCFIKWKIFVFGHKFEGGRKKHSKKSQIGC